ncbi:MAG TPA: RpiB/LacA/LacB family sugar-phosphate isomerase [Candidatus Paceibacterota bacterium]|nr:RpiB/LacA/LacB family sugar-phosphate isomerase [Candidatus Paceibacterota bacterium]
MKKVFLASDHAGFELKSALAVFLGERGYVVEDLGPHNYELADDYPDTIAPLARAVADDKESFGIAIGYSGQGEAMVCNRVNGVRAAVYYGVNKEILTLSRQHNDANVLSLGAHFLSQDEAKEAVLLWIETPFSNEERHMRRVGKLN